MVGVVFVLCNVYSKSTVTFKNRNNSTFDADHRCLHLITESLDYTGVGLR